MKISKSACMALGMALALTTYFGPVYAISGPSTTYPSVMDVHLDASSVDNVSIDGALTITLSNVNHPENVTVISTNLHRNPSLAVTVARTIQFSGWSNQTNGLTSSEPANLLVENVTGSFPDETIALEFFVGSNFSLARTPSVSWNIPGYSSTVTATEIAANFTNSNYYPTNVVSLSSTYYYVYHVVVISEQTRDIQYLASFMSSSPILVGLLATLLVIGSFLRMCSPVRFQKGLKANDYVQGLLTLLLFIPILLFSAEQLFPTVGNPFAESWLVSVETNIGTIFVLILIYVVASISFSFYSRRSSSVSEPEGY